MRDVTQRDKLLRTDRFHHVNRIASFAPPPRVIRRKDDSRLGDATSVQDKSKLILSVAFSVETKLSLCRLR